LFHERLQVYRKGRSIRVEYGGWRAKINEGRYQDFSGKGLPFLIICASQRSSVAKLLSRR
jgi:hypothetical protein